MGFFLSLSWLCMQMHNFHCIFRNVQSPEKTTGHYPNSVFIHLDLPEKHGAFHHVKTLKITKMTGGKCTDHLDFKMKTQRKVTFLLHVYVLFTITAKINK